MNDKIKNRILKLKSDKNIINNYLNIFKNNSKAKEVFKDNYDFQKLSEKELKKDIDE